MNEQVLYQIGKDIGELKSHLERIESYLQCCYGAYDLNTFQGGAPPPIPGPPRPTPTPTPTPGAGVEPTPPPETLI